MSEWIVSFECQLPVTLTFGKKRGGEKWNPQSSFQTSKTARHVYIERRTPPCHKYSLWRRTTASFQITFAENKILLLFSSNYRADPPFLKWQKVMWRGSNHDLLILRPLPERFWPSPNEVYSRRVFSSLFSPTIQLYGSSVSLSHFTFVCQV